MAIATSSPSVLVAVIVSVKSASLSAGGVIVSAPKSQSEISIAVSPGAAVNTWVPSVRIAPSGISETSVMSASLLSTSVRAVVRSKLMAVSSSPVAGAAVTTGVSATGFTITPSGAVVTAVSVPSVLVAVTVSVKSASLSAGGVIVSAGRSQLETSTTLSGAVETNVFAPSVSVAPSGMPESSVVSTSLPSRSLRADVIARLIAVSSSPAAGAVVTTGASAIGLTATSRG